MRWITLAIAVVAVIVRASACTSVCDKHVVERLRHLDEGMKELAGDFFGLFAPSLMFPFEASSSLFWERVTESLLSKETAHLYFFGGSMVLGKRCKEGGVEGVNCAYPNRVGSMLRFLLSKGHANPLELRSNRNSDSAEAIVSVINLAKGGTSTDAFVPTFAQTLAKLEPPPSALFFDFSVNDASVSSQQAPGSASKQDSQNPPIATESIVRYMKQNHPSIPFFFIETRCDAASQPMYASKRKVLEQYQVPLISYREAIGGPTMCQKPFFWGKKIYHPPAVVHQNVAYAVVTALFYQGRLSCKQHEEEDDYRYPPLLSLAELTKVTQEFALVGMSDPVYPLAVRRGISICPAMSTLDAFDRDAVERAYASKKIRVLKGNWTYYEDVPGKPGWISTEEGSVIRFNVVLTAAYTRLLVGYLQSYENIGDMLMSVESPYFNLKDTLVGRHDQLTSVTFARTINVSKVGKAVTKGALIKTEFRATVTLTSLSNAKVKLSYLITC